MALMFLIVLVPFVSAGFDDPCIIGNVYEATGVDYECRYATDYGWTIDRIFNGSLYECKCPSGTECIQDSTGTYLKAKCDYPCTDECAIGEHDCIVSLGAIVGRPCGNYDDDDQKLFIQY